MIFVKSLKQKKFTFFSAFNTKICWLQICKIVKLLVPTTIAKTNLEKFSAYVRDFLVAKILLPTTINY